MDDLVERLVAREIEKAWREGWSIGYRAGRVDGGSDSTWCDKETDWQESDTRATITSSAR